MSSLKKPPSPTDRAYEAWQKENEEKKQAIIEAIKELRIAIACRIKRLRKAKKVKDREDRIAKDLERDHLLSIYTELISEDTITPDAGIEYVQNLFEIVLDIRDKIKKV